MWKEAEQFLLKDTILHPLIKKYGPCRIKPSRKKDYFSDLVNAITSQQLSEKASATIFGRVVKGLGEIKPENILKTKDTKFRSWGLSRAKTVYVKDLAKKVKNRELKINNLNKLPDEEILNELTTVKGIGRWTAEMFLMFSLARPDVFPIDDLGINNGIVKLLGRKVTGDKLAKYATRWKPHRTVAAWYVWKILDSG